MKSVDDKVIPYIVFDVEKNDKDPKFKTVDHIKISKYKIFLQEDTHRIGPKKVFVVKNVKNIVYSKGYGN